MVEYVVFALVAVVAFVAIRWFRDARRRELRQVAAERGWSFTTSDPGISALPLLVLSASVRRRVENVLHGELAGRTVTMFDLNDPREESWGKKPQEGAGALSCAVVRIPARLSHVVIEPDDWTALAHAPGLDRSEFEWGEFGERFDVWTSDALGAHTIIDARLMAWLVDHADDVRFELHEDLVACTVARRSPSRVPELAGTLLAFVERIPDVAMARYGQRT